MKRKIITVLLSILLLVGCINFIYPLVEWVLNENMTEMQVFKKYILNYIIGSVCIYASYKGFRYIKIDI
jgi:hypothetical protein